MDRHLAQPHVSIIIPTNNSGETIGECLKSVKGQDYPLCEVIVVDNYSKDNTLEMAKKFGAKTIRQRSNPAHARNLAVENSTSKYVLFLDSDQVMSPTVVKDCVQQCENEKVGMVVIPEIFIGKGFWSSCSAAWKNCFEEVARLYGNKREIIRNEPRFFIRKEIIRVGMLNNSLHWGEDYDLYRKLKKANTRETECKSRIYHYELTSLRNVLVKNLRYGKFMPFFVQQTKKRIFPSITEHEFLTLRKLLKTSWNSPSLILGCTVLLCIKSYSIAIGFLTGISH